jgi:hypothetical protein
MRVGRYWVCKFAKSDCFRVSGSFSGFVTTSKDRTSILVSEMFEADFSAGTLFAGSVQYAIAKNDFPKPKDQKQVSEDEQTAVVQVA